MGLWIFPGQPLKAENRLPEDADFMELSELAALNCGYDLHKNEPLSRSALSPHTCLQLYGVAWSLYKVRKARRSGDLPTMLSGHSLGIYAALAVAGSVTEVEALELTARVGCCISGFAENGSYSFGCPIGIKVDPVEAAAKNNGVHVANYNSSQHFLLAGDSRQIEAALAECQQAGAFSVSSYRCEAPLHTPLLSALDRQLAEIVADYRFNEPTVPLLESFSQTFLTAAVIPLFLVQQLQKPVYWEKTWLYLRRLGFESAAEHGNAQPLTKFNRWIDMEYGGRGESV